MKKITTILSVGFLLVGVSYLITAVPALAQTDLNPIGVTDPRILIGRIINAILGIVGSLALLAFIVGGLTWVTSAGNDEKVKKGQEKINWATIGLVIIFLAYVIVSFLITSLTGQNGGVTEQPGGVTEQPG